MSLSNQKTTEHPCKKWIEYSGTDGTWSYYNKETKSKIPVPELRFVVLDELSGITGWSDSLSTGIYSNEIHDLSKQELTVKSFKPGVAIKGLYADIKDSVKSAGGKFTKNVYVLLEETSGMTLACIKMSGSALGGWIEKECKTYENIITVEDYTEGKKGAVTFKIPVFKAVGKLEGVALENAIEQDKLLQEYFKQYENMKSAEIKSDYLDAHSDDIQENPLTAEEAEKLMEEDDSVKEILVEKESEGLPF